jgi:hypothetical protein
MDGLGRELLLLFYGPCLLIHCNAEKQNPAEAGLYSPAFKIGS